MVATPGRYNGGSNVAIRPSLVLVWATKYALHILAHLCAFLLAYELRRALPLGWWISDPDALRVAGWSVLFALIGAVVEAVFQTERAAWRFASLRDVVALARNVTLTVGLFVGVVFVADRGMELPRSVLPMAWILTIVALVGIRLMFRLPRDRAVLNELLPSWWSHPVSHRKPLLLAGAMEAADRQIRHMLADPAAVYQPIGILTPEGGFAGVRVQGVPWLGTLADWRVVRTRARTPAALLFLEDPVRNLRLSPEQIGEMRSSGLRLLRTQVLTQFDEDNDSAGHMALREIPLEEFLPRQPLSLGFGPVRELIAGKRVLVTGGGGSIGSEIARQLTRLGCSRLAIVDNSEFRLFEICRELDGAAGDTAIRAVIGDVRDAGRMREVLLEERPDLVFHAAALKHVGLVENNPVEGVRTNVVGTWNVIAAAAEAGADQFVLISTDKAAAPTTVMGASKRVAEALLEVAPAGHTRFLAVRFGNVLGSAGSVVPIFQEQIARGGPVTVTHPDVERFFMTIPEAVQLVLHSTAIAAVREEGTAKFLLDMGEPVKIVELARQMIQLSGKIPDVDIAIQFTGLKPGEKLSEILSDEGEEVRPCVEGIMEVFSAGTQPGLSRASLDALIAVAIHGEPTEVAEALHRAVRQVRQQEGATGAPLDTVG